MQKDVFGYASLAKLVSVYLLRSIRTSPYKISEQGTSGRPICRSDMQIYNADHLLCDADISALINYMLQLTVRAGLAPIRKKSST